MPENLLYNNIVIVTFVIFFKAEFAKIWSFHVILDPLGNQNNDTICLHASFQY